MSITDMYVHNYNEWLFALSDEGDEGEGGRRGGGQVTLKGGEGGSHRKEGIWRYIERRGHGGQGT